ncbi:OmpA family protein [Pseudomonas sp. PCH199]|uniref:OmpA family protein n=1 Tax=unclassified Pseudomonas TaxID=196821 RepID=UPI000BC55D43|nr:MULTISPECIES: OmpA family protein [unclassified Pseudomonas]MCW8278226.1 OmpA family protein [Pseudomonas sp. PCH199]PAM81533.1 flagellar motor protein MotB [Pseudomonas sp. ERMR1:02]
MTFKHKRGLWLWAATLVITLLVIMPLTMWARTTVILAVVVCVALAWKRIAKRAIRQQESLVIADDQSLPQASYRHPVVLVCGDGLPGLFGAVPAEQLALRITGQGCYVRVPSVELLPEVADSLIAVRPGWGRQLSVMFIVNPQEQTDREVLAGRVRALRHQVMRVRKRGIALPLLLSSYLQASRGQGPWFSWEAGQSSLSVREAGECVGLDDWQVQAASSAIRASRLQTGVQLNGIAAWLAEEVQPYLTSGEARTSRNLPVVSAITLVAALPQKVDGNLRQHWLRDKFALVGLQQPDVCEALPFPDPLLTLLPKDTRYSANRRASVIALWLFTAAGLVALVSSAWQNTLLARQVSDDVRRYASVAPAEFARREEAMTVLHEDAVRLDGYYRHGEPLSLGFGLYRGNDLREHLLEVIAGHRQPSTAVATTVRLDSLSLFSSGSAQLKPDSAKVLINALVDIKAQPGWLIVIGGHTDASGSAEQNLHLSRARAAAVHNWMRQMGGIPDNCFAVQGFGASQPIASNDTEAGRQANRRVDIRLIPDVGACVLPTAGTGKQPPSHNATFTN